MSTPLREVFFDGPKPDPGAQFCVICALRFKAEVLDIAEDRIQAAMRGEGPDRLDLAELGQGKAKLPELAVGYGLAPQLGGALVPLCWSHLQAVKFTGMTLAGPGDMAALGNGQPTPLLGRR